ncbi:hypothetical protein E4U21_001533 [Claviceps maximensis]|nr:hypothetical protein E4U21_001533 [Claviceps maximensis]
MPVELTSSVDVASTERAQRIQRSISTEATGRGAEESMLSRRPEMEDLSVECPDEEDAEEDDL